MILWQDKYHPHTSEILPFGLFLMLHQRTSATIHPPRSYWIRKSHLENLYKALRISEPNERPENLQGLDP